MFHFHQAIMFYRNYLCVPLAANYRKAYQVGTGTNLARITSRSNSNFTQTNFFLFLKILYRYTKSIFSYAKGVNHKIFDNYFLSKTVGLVNPIFLLKS